jgi:hypothetical protein
VGQGFRRGEGGKDKITIPKLQITNKALPYGHIGTSIVGSTHDYTKWKR